MVDLVGLVVERRWKGPRRRRRRQVVGEDHHRLEAYVEDR